MTDRRIGDKLIEHDLCEARLFADPDFDGETLLLALAISRALRDGCFALRRVRLETGPEDESAEAAPQRTSDALRRAQQTLRLGPDAGHRDPNWRLRRLIERDIPRYEIHPPECGHCDAPMVKRSGVCGQRTRNSVAVRSRDDGRLTWHFYCARHRDWGTELYRSRPDVADCPTPPCNAGGLLMRHFPDWDWETLYRWAYGRGWKEWKPPADAFPNVAGMWGGIFEASE